MDEQTLINKVAWIINDHPDRVKWDIPKYILISELVQAYEKLEEEKEVQLYE
jgi:hypothetical protein